MTDEAFHHGKIYNFNLEIMRGKGSKQEFFVDSNLNWGPSTILKQNNLKKNE